MCIPKIPQIKYENVLGASNDKVGREYILKQTIWHESLHEISNDSGVRAVNFATSKNLTEM
jgi:hypothetical protein